MKHNTYTKQLVQNIIPVRNNRWALVAGQHQFKTIWYRDGCYALLNIMQCSPVTQHFFRPVMVDMIELYLEEVNEDGYGPKCADVMNPEWRTVRECIYTFFHLGRTNGSFDDDGETPYELMYEDGRESIAIDSNLLIYLLAKTIAYPDDPRVDALLTWYDPYKRPSDGLIVQEPYSDWQDSQDRSPVTFLTNLMYWRALVLSRKWHAAHTLQKTLVHTFWNKEDGLFHAMGKTHPNVCLEDQLFALDWGFSTRLLFYRLQHHPLWVRPGFPTWPDYTTQPHFQVKLAGLGHYHDSLYWSWLIAFSGIIALKFGDVKMGGWIWETMSSLNEKDGGVSEVYTMTDKGLIKFKNARYEAETPWSWGVSYMIRFAEMMIT